MDDDSGMTEKEKKERDEKYLNELKTSLTKSNRLSSTIMDHQSNGNGNGNHIAEEMGLDGSVEEENAARLIQDKFRGLKIMRNSKDSSNDEKGNPDRKLN